MICPECGTSKTSVVKTVVLPGQATRMRECACGVRFLTVEKVSCRVAPATTGNSRQPAGNHGQPRATARNGPQPAGNPPATTGGKGGGLSSDLFPSLLSLDSSSPISNSVEVVSKTRARGPGIEYPAEWERFWATTTKAGSKEKAYKVWVRRGRHDVDALIAAWADWMKLQSWQDGYSKHPESWLGGGYYLQEPSEPVKKTNASPSANGSVRSAATGYGTVSKHTSTGQQEL